MTEALARSLYAHHTWAPPWDQLGEATRQVWIERARRQAAGDPEWWSCLPQQDQPMRYLRDYIEDVQRKESSQSSCPEHHNAYNLTHLNGGTVDIKNASIEALIDLRRQRKEAEDKAVAERREVDAEIVARMPAETLEETVSQKIGGFKVSVTYSMARKVDSAKLQHHWTELTPEEQAAFRWKPEVATAEYRKLGPEQLTNLARFIESKPASPSLKVEA